VNKNETVHLETYRAGDCPVILVTEDDFSVDEILRTMKRPEVGALVSFLGTVKGVVGREEVHELEIESYKDMALKRMHELRKEAIERFGVTDVSIVHRVGRLKPSENIVLIVVSSRDRRKSFEACHWLIDEMKRTAPIWKKERTASGERWVKEEGSD
jgi:molybdopterin synthase catalytic subunit